MFLGLLATSVCWLAVLAFAALVWGPDRRPDDAPATAGPEWWRA